MREIAWLCADGNNPIGKGKLDDSEERRESYWRTVLE